MTYEQTAQIKKLAAFLPMLESINESISDIYAKIEKIQVGRKGPIPGLADIKKRVEQLEHAVRIED